MNIGNLETWWKDWKGIRGVQNPSIGIVPYLPFLLPAFHLLILPLSYPPLCQLSPDGDLPKELCLIPQQDRGRGA